MTGNGAQGASECPVLASADVSAQPTNFCFARNSGRTEDALLVPLMTEADMGLTGFAEREI
jgi:hypothetical protein